MQKIKGLLIIIVVLSGLVSHAFAEDVPIYTYRVINAYPHDMKAFTQGLVYEGGFLYEGTGIKGASTLRKVKLETGKCISCGSCVRACAEIKGFHVFSFVNRGFVTRMRAPFGRSLVDTTCDGCGECVKVCPTAALREKAV